ncbi:MAG: (d)CMP kinase [Clostridiaceae bacterium]
MKLTIAVDGPAGAGKSTIAKIISEKFNIMYINTGAMYRAVTLFALRNNIPPDDTNGLCRLIGSLKMHFDKNRLIVNGEDVSELIVHPDISKRVSEYAAVREIRELLVKLQQGMALQYGVIMDGRDIGTVVLKDAFIKFYLIAGAEERARRRYKELTEKGLDVHCETILEDINKRDHIDSNRECNPLKKAADAIEIDSSLLNIDEVVQVMSDYINEKIEKNSITVD